MMSERERIEMTCNCQDADRIPKVDNAGQIIINAQGKSVQIMHNGLEVIEGGYYGDFISEIIQRCKGHHEPQEELVFYEVLKRIPKQATMIEVGGYWVYYCLWFLKDFPKTRQAFAIEPDPEHIKVGQQNAALNNLHVSFVQGFIGKEHGIQKDFQTEKSGVITMPSISIEGLMQDNKLNHVDLILCDAQGGELEMLGSLDQLVSANKLSYIIISTHANQITGDPLTHQKCLKIIQDLGGQILAEHDVHESFSGDGLIAAKFGEHLSDWVELKLSRNRYSTSLFRNPLYDLAELMYEKAKLQHDLIQIKNDHSQLQMQLNKLIDSKSWKITSPLRTLSNWLKKLLA